MKTKEEILAISEGQLRKLAPEERTPILPSVGVEAAPQPRMQPPRGLWDHPFEWKRDATGQWWCEHLPTGRKLKLKGEGSFTEAVIATERALLRAEKNVLK